MKTGLFFIIFLITLTSICDTLNQFFLKSAINSLQVSLSSSIREIIRFILRLLRIPYVWLSFFFATLSLGIWLFVLSQVDLNLAFSVDSMHYVFIAFTSKMLLKEKVGMQRWLGTIFIVAGILVVTLS